MSADVWFTRCPVPTAFSLAVSTGRLTERLTGLDTAFRSLATAHDEETRTTHFTQAQPRSVRHGGNIPPLVAASRGADVAIIGLSVAPSNAALLARPESGITSAEDLRGKVIGIPRRLNDPVDFWRATVLQGVTRAVRTAGLTLDDVELRDIEIGRSFASDSTSRDTAVATLWDAAFMLGFQREESAALLSGRVDAIFAEGANRPITEAFTGATAVVEAGETAHTDPRLSSNLRPLTLSVTGDLLRADPSIVDAILDETTAAAVWAQSQADAARRIIAAEVGVAEELLDRSFAPGLAAELDVSLDPDRLVLLEHQIAFLYDQGFLDRAVDVAEVVVDRAAVA